MTTIQLDDFYCECDNKEGIGELDIRQKKYICLRCQRL